MDTNPNNQIPDFTTGDVIFTAPQGNRISATSVSEVAGSNGTQFDIVFPKQLQPRRMRYTLVVGADVRDTFNNQMDQNNNLIAGEASGDGYSVMITKAGIIGFAEAASSAVVPVAFTETRLIELSQSLFAFLDTAGIDAVFGEAAVRCFPNLIAATKPKTISRRAGQPRDT